MNTKKVITSGLMTALLAGSAYAVDITWTGAANDNDWDNATNWGGTFPAPGDNIFINSAGAADYAIYSGETNNSFRQVFVGVDTAGRLDVTSGTLTSNNFQARLGLGNGGLATVNVSGGNLDSPWVQIGLDAGSDGTVNLTNGAVNLFGTGSNFLGMDLGNGGQGAFNASGGSLSTRGGVVLGANSGTGVFSVQGSGATIGIGGLNNNNGYWHQNAGSTLQALVDTDGTLSTIVINGSAGGPNDVTFADGALLDLGFLGDDFQGSWDLLTTTGLITDSGLGFAAGVDTSKWSFSFEDTGGAVGADTLRVTAIPEPSALSLMVGMLGLSLVFVRRRSHN